MRFTKESYWFHGESKHENRLLCVDGFREILDCKIRNLLKVGRKSANSSPSFLDYLSVRNQVFFFDVLTEQVSKSFRKRITWLLCCFEQQNGTIWKSCRREKTCKEQLNRLICLLIVVRPNTLHKWSSLIYAKCMFQFSVSGNFACVYAGKNAKISWQ